MQSTVPTEEKSPDTELFNMQYSWQVSRYGNTDYIDAVYDDSYGNKTPSTITVLGAYVKKRRDIFIDARRYMKHEAR